MASDKQWSAPVWKGLVMDESGKHYRGMRNAIWLFLYLLLNANRRSGFLVRKIRTISRDIGVSRDTILRWLRVLRTGGYVATQNTGRCLRIQIQKWKPLPGARRSSHQKYEASDIRSGGNPTPQTGRRGHPPPGPGREAPSFVRPNDIKIKKELLNNDIETKDFSASRLSSRKDFKPTNRQELLALDLAEGLNDRKGLALYLSYAKRYPESLLRQVLGEVKEIPSEKIKKSRGALFNHIIQKYGQTTNNHPGH